MTNKKKVEETVIHLPKLPEGTEFEEYISACLQLGGYYIERNIIERDVEEILELDIILTNYDTSVPEITLVEVKSGDWGFRDLFKVNGWMNYLNIPKGIFIANKEKSNFDFSKEKATKLNIQLAVIPTTESNQVLSILLPRIDIGSIDENDIEYWRFSYWIERKLIERLTHKKKSCPQMECFKVLANYYHETSSGIFFTENVIRKIDKLYSIFMESPHITAKTGYELIGNDFEEEYDKLPDKIYSDTFYDCKYNDIQICTFLEHRARLAILKSAVDYKLYKDAGVGSKADDVTTKILGFEFNLIDSLPSSFKQGLDTISKHEYFRRYPVFWQWFMWVFGGFILKDYEEKEYEILSKKTGIPIDEIPNAFGSYQILFPMQSGWFADFSPRSNITIMKMFPVPFMGVGVNYRRALYVGTEEQKLKGVGEMEVTGRYTLHDLIMWNNLLVEVLM